MVNQWLATACEESPGCPKLSFSLTFSCATALIEATENIKIVPFSSPACAGYFHHCQRVIRLHRRGMKNSLSKGIAQPAKVSNLGHSGQLTDSRNKTLANTDSFSLSPRHVPARALLDGLFSNLPPQTEK